MSKRPFSLASGLRLFFWMFLAGCATAQAAKFDERIKAPRAASVADLKRSVREYFAAYEQRRKEVDEADDAIRDPKAYDAWINLQWMIEQQAGEPTSLDDLREFGMQKDVDGSYTVRAKEYPQWMPLDLALMTLRVPSVFDSYAPDLKARGFRDQDLAILKNYVASNNWEREAYLANKPLTESFAARAQHQNRVNRRVDEDETQAYMYQATRNSLQARRSWAVGLLDTLDKQRQRILISYLREFDAVRSFGPARSEGSKSQRVVARLLSGEYVEDLKQQEQRTRQ